MEAEEDLFWYAYQCKQCPERFKTTVDLQKHKRLNHRNSNGLSGQPLSLAPVVMVSSSPPAAPVIVNGEMEIEPGPTPPSTGETGEISATPSGRHVACSFCCYKYDTLDTVVLHLLKLCRRESDDGCLKCPSCLKVKLQIELGDEDEASKESADGKGDDSSPTSPTPVKSPPTKRRKTTASPSPPPKRRISLRNRSSTNIASGSSSASSSAPVTRERRRAPNEEGTPLGNPTRHPIKRGSSGSQQVMEMEKSTERESLYKSTLRRVSPRTPSAPANSPVVLSSSSGFNAPSRLPPSIAAVASQIIKSKDSEYQPIPNGKLDRRRRVSTKSRPDDNHSKSESPRKVPVLINDNPVSSPKGRVAVPKGKDLNKRNLTCEHCGHVAENCRKFQSHLTTHMAVSYPCDFCPNLYRTLQSKMKHTKRHHATELHEQRRTALANSRAAAMDEVQNQDVQSVSNHSNSSTASTVCSTDWGSSIDNVNHDGTLNNMSLNMSTTSHASITVVETPKDQLSTSEREPREFFMLQVLNGTVVETKVLM